MMHNEAWLAPLEWAFRAGVAARALAYDRGWITSRRLPVPVVSVGNLSVGGEGKTPVVIRLARDLIGLGKRVAVVSRGYGRTHPGRTLSVTSGSSPAEAGDEPVLIARSVPGVSVVVGPDKWSAGRAAVEQHGAQVVVLDDGFQHRRLARDVNLVCLDADTPAQAHLVPRGRFREPLSAVRRADLVVVTRANPASPGRLEEIRNLISRVAPGMPSVEVGFTLSGVVPADQHVVAVSGIARPERFERDLEGRGAKVVKTLRFRDHHRYTAGDLELISRASDGGRVVTTEKDRVRLEEALRTVGREWPAEWISVGLVCDIPAGPGRALWDAKVLSRLS